MQQKGFPNEKLTFNTPLEPSNAIAELGEMLGLDDAKGKVIFTDDGNGDTIVTAESDDSTDVMTELKNKNDEFKVVNHDPYALGDDPIIEGRS